jgi:hypothetical protein
MTECGDRLIFVVFDDGEMEAKGEARARAAFLA